MIDMNRLSNGISLPKDVANEVLGLVSETSAVMTVSKRIDLPGGGVSIPVVTGMPEANWTDETDELTVSRPGFGAKEMTGYKLGVIVPFSKEFVRDLPALYDAAVSMLPSALALKFDQTVAGTSAPGDNFDVLGDAAGFVVDGSQGEIEAIIKALAGSDAEVSGWIASPKFHAELITARDGNGNLLYNAGQSQNVGSVYGAPVHRVKRALVAGVAEAASTIGLAGDFAGSATYGVVEGVTLSVSNQSTINDGGTQLNLWQRDMVAVKATVELGFRVGDKSNFVKITDK